MNQFAPMGANSCLYEITPVYMGGEDVNYRVVSPESIPLHLKRTTLWYRSIPKQNRYMPIIQVEMHYRSVVERCNAYDGQVAP